MSPWRLPVSFAVLGAPLVAVAGFFGLHREGVGPVLAPKSAEARTNDIVISDAVLRENPITTVKVVKARLASDLQVVGSVTYDQNHFAVVGPLVAGRIAELGASLGDTVKAGQILAVVESADVGQAQAAFLSSKARARAAESNSARERELAAQHISSARESELAEAQATSEKAEVRAASERLKALGLGAADLTSLEKGASDGGRVALRSPIGGTVVARSVTLGEAVAPATDAFKIADLSRLWVLLDLYEKDLRRVTVGQNVEARTEAAPGEVFLGRVAYVNPLVDEKTRTAGVRIEIVHREGRLRPGQFVTARLLGDPENVATAVTAVPRRSVQTVEGKKLVFCKTPAGYEPRTIEIGVSAGDLVEVTTGLREGEEIVDDGAFVLKSELLR